MNKKISTVSSILQMVILSSLFILNNFANQSAGVNHHVIARKYQWESTIFSNSNLSWISLAMWIIIMILAIIALKQKNKKMFLKIEMIKLIASGIFVEASSRFTVFRNLNIMSYITLGALIIFLIQATVTLIDILLQKNNID